MLTFYRENREIIIVAVSDNSSFYSRAPETKQIISQSSRSACVNYLVKKPPAFFVQRTTALETNLRILPSKQIHADYRQTQSCTLPSLFCQRITGNLLLGNYASNTAHVSSSICAKRRKWSLPNRNWMRQPLRCNLLSSEPSQLLLSQTFLKETQVWSSLMFGNQMLQFFFFDRSEEF